MKKKCYPCDPCFKCKPKDNTATGSDLEMVDKRIRCDLKSYKDKLSEQEIEILKGLSEQEFYK